MSLKASAAMNEKAEMAANACNVCLNVCDMIKLQLDALENLSSAHGFAELRSAR